MTESVRRIGRLGLFVAMAGVSWLVEACGGSTSEPEHPSGGTGGTASGGATNSGGAAQAGTGGTSVGGSVPTLPGTGGDSTVSTGGGAGLYDLPCE